MQMETLLSCLYEKKLVTYEEYCFLAEGKMSQRERNRYLLSILPTKGEGALDQFIKCLKQGHDHSGHADLAKLLEEAMEIPFSEV